MAKITFLLLLITLSCFLSLALCRTIDDEKSSRLEISPATDDAAAGIEQSNPRWWFRGRFRPRRPWPLVHPPIPAAGGFTWPPNRPWPHWEFVSPPRPAGGFKWPPNDGWPRWHFVNPPMPAGGGFTWPPRGWPHWRFVQPPMPSGGGSNPAAETTAAAPAA